MSTFKNAYVFFDTSIQSHFLSAAAGKDGHFGPKPWDMAAAMLIVSEAGGITADPADGSPLDYTSGRVSASNSRELLQLFLQCVNDSSASSGASASRL